MHASMLQQWAGKIAFIGGLLTPFIVVPLVIMPSTIPRGAWMVAVGILSLYALLQDRSAQYSVSKTDIFFGLYVLACIVSAIFGANIRASFWSDATRALGVAHLIAFLLWLALARAQLREEKNQKLFWYLVAGQALAVSVLSLFRPVFFDCVDPNRLCGSFGNPMIYGEWLSPLALILPVGFLQAARLKLHPFFRFIVLPFALLFVLVALYLTLTRGAVLGVAAGALVAAALYVARRFVNGKKIVAVAAVCAVVIGALLFMARTSFAVQKIILLGRGSTTIETRVIDWTTALRGVHEHPLLGRGPENYRAVADTYFDPRLLDFSYYETRVDKPHNHYLEILIATGGIGLILYLAFVCVVFWVLYRQGMQYGIGTSALLCGAFVALQFILLISFETYASLAALGTLLLAVPQTDVIFRVHHNRFVRALCYGIAAVACIYGIIAPLRSAYLTQGALGSAAIQDFGTVAATVQRIYAAPIGPYDFEIWQWTSGALLSEFDADVTAAARIPEPARTLWHTAVQANGQRTIAYIDTNKLDSRWQLFGGKAAYHTALVLDDPSYLAVAERAFVQAQTLSPYAQEASDILVYVYMLQPDYPRAVAALVHGVQIRDTTEIQTTADVLVTRLTQEKQFELLAQLFLQLIAIHPTADRYARLAATYAVLHDPVHARDAVQHAVELDPSYAADAQNFLKQLH